MKDLSKLTILDDKFALLETIGTGTFSQVKLAYDLTHSEDKMTPIPIGGDCKKYAIKVFKTPSRDSEAINAIQRKNFMSEIASLQ